MRDKPTVPFFGAKVLAPVVLGLFTFSLGACGYGAATCQVIDVAKEACGVIRYLGPDGKPRQVTVTQHELAAFGQAMEQRRSLERAPGVDGGAK